MSIKSINSSWPSPPSVLIVNPRFFLAAHMGPTLAVDVIIKQKVDVETVEVVVEVDT